MSYTSKGGYSSSREIRMLLSAINGGVRFSSDDGKMDDNVCVDMANMWFRDGMLRTRPGVISPFADKDFGNIHSVTKRTFFGHTVYHAGNSLVKFDGANPPEVIASDVPDCDSFFAEIGSVLYLFTKDEKLLSVDREFKVEEVIPYVPTIMRNAAPSLKTYDAGEELNLIGRKITIRYDYSVNGTHFNLPYPADLECDITITFDDEQSFKLDQSKIFSENQIKLDTQVLSEYVDVTYTVAKGCEADKAGMIFGCTFAESFGGTTMEGTRLFVSGNPDYPGYYFRSDLLNPSYFKDLDFDIIGSGNDSVTAFSKQYGGMLVFTERSVGRIVYSFDEGGADFTVKEINSRTGCDMPGSVALIDNKTVFANSRGGVYIVSGTENQDETNIVRLSGNIMGKSADGKRGFGAESVESLMSGVAIDFDGKYMLFTKNCTYIWDYTMTPFYSTVYTSSKEKDLCWFVFEGTGAKHVFESEKGELFFFSHGVNVPYTLCDTATRDVSGDIVSFFHTKSFDAGMPHLMKHLRRVLASVLHGGNSQVTLGIFSEGTKHGLYREDIDASAFSWDSLCWDKLSFYGNLAKSHIIKLPHTRHTDFSVKVECKGGSFGISELECIFSKAL